MISPPYLFNLFDKLYSPSMSLRWTVHPISSIYLLTHTVQAWALDDQSTLFVQFIC